MLTSVVDFDRAEALAGRLAAIPGNRQVYGADHARTADAIRAFRGALCAYFDESPDKRAFRLGVRNGRLTHEGIPLGKGNTVARLAAELERRNCAGIGFSPDARQEAIRKLSDWLVSDDRAGTFPTIKGIDLLFDEDAVKSEVPVEEESDLEPQLQPFKMPVRIFRTASGVLQRVLYQTSRMQRPDFEEVAQVSRWTAEEAIRQGTQLLAPVQLLKTDSYTYQHSVNVLFLATVLLGPLASGIEELARWARAALLHDIGKARVSPELLHKRTPLNEDEFAILRRHPEFGAQALLECGETDPLAIEVAYCHHMRDDGHGYPPQRPGLAPGPVCNVIQVADMFEALTSRRPDKAAQPVSEAVRIIHQTPGMQSKSAAIRLLIDRMTETPPGAEVRLASGARGVVVRTGIGARQTIQVLLLHDPAGRAYREPRLVDLEAKKSPTDDDDSRIVEVRLKPERYTVKGTP